MVTAIGRSPSSSLYDRIAAYAAAIPRKIFLLVALLAAAAVAISALPLLGAGGHLNWILWQVATHRIDRVSAFFEILGVLGGWLSSWGAVRAAMWWIVTYVSEYGVWSIGGAIASLIAEGGIVGLAIAIIGAATLG